MDYKFTPRNVLPNGLTLLQVNPDCAAQETEKRGWVDFWSEELGD